MRTMDRRSARKCPPTDNDYDSRLSRTSSLILLAMIVVYGVRSLVDTSELLSYGFCKLLSYMSMQRFCIKDYTCKFVRVGRP